MGRDDAEGYAVEHRTFGKLRSRGFTGITKLLTN